VWQPHGKRIGISEINRAFEAVPVRVSFRAKRKREDLSGGPPKPSMQANKPRRGR